MPILTPTDLGSPSPGGVASELWLFVRWFLFHGTRLDRLAVPSDPAEPATSREACKTRV